MFANQCSVTSRTRVDCVVVVKTKPVHAGGNQLSATSEAQNLPAADAETSQAWNQYQMSQQHGAIDNTDGSQIGHPQNYGMMLLLFSTVTVTNVL